MLTKSEMLKQKKNILAYLLHLKNNVKNTIEHYRTLSTDDLTEDDFRENVLREMDRNMLNTYRGIENSRDKLYHFTKVYSLKLDYDDENILEILISKDTENILTELKIKIDDLREQEYNMTGRNTWKTIQNYIKNMSIIEQILDDISFYIYANKFRTSRTSKQ
jgi:hypothetical protein